MCQASFSRQKHPFLIPSRVRLFAHCPVFLGPTPRCSGGAAKRRRTVLPAAALAAKIAALEAAVASGKARGWPGVAEVEADNARLSIEVATLRKLPQLPAWLLSTAFSPNRIGENDTHCRFPSWRYLK